MPVTPAPAAVGEFSESGPARCGGLFLVAAAVVVLVLYLTW